ncbi:hypothetical protein L3X07_02705 [Levilactobacillus brevis]|nr:hypothetical protein [Levilactobacillus brevis]
MTTVLASADGQYVYFKTTATAERPKLPSPQAFPQTRHVDRLINKADGYGWLPLNVTYRLRCYQPETGAVTELFQHGFDFDVTSVSAPDAMSQSYMTSNPTTIVTLREAPIVMMRQPARPSS